MTKSAQVSLVKPLDLTIQREQVSSYTWPRFPETVVPEFLQGMRELGSDDDN